jgi:hypothetical protein
VNAVLDRSDALHAATSELHAAVRWECARAAKLRDLGAARRGGHWSTARVAYSAAPSSPGQGGVLPVSEAPAPLTLGSRTSGRIVRRGFRPRLAAASPRPLPGATPDSGDARGTRWAQATVYAMRTITDTDKIPGADVGGVEEGTPCDHTGRGTWTVRELDASGVPGARGPRCLVFENHEVVRRVWDFPATWETLPAAGLLRLAGELP